MEWHSDERERVLAVLARDRADGDFGGVVLGRDTRRRFRATPVRIICKGICHDHNEDAAVSTPFALDVSDPGYTETWVQGANVFHNPFAMYPLDESFLVHAAHHRFDGGVVRSLIPEFHPYQSQTIILTRKRLRR